MARLSDAQDRKDIGALVAVLLGVKSAIRARWLRGDVKTQHGSTELRINEIAACSMCSYRTVARHLKTLKAAGLIRVQPRQNEIGENLPSIYELVWRLDGSSSNAEGAGHFDGTSGQIARTSGHFDGRLGHGLSNTWPRSIEEGEEEKESPSVSTARPKSRKGRTPCPVTWSAESGWQGITEQMRQQWGNAFPACDLDTQLARMAAWLAANPTKARKSNWLRFITGWLERAQDRGGDVKASAAKTPTPYRGSTAATLR